MKRRNRLHRLFKKRATPMLGLAIAAVVLLPNVVVGEAYLLSKSTSSFSSSVTIIPAEGCGLASPTNDQDSSYNAPTSPGFTGLYITINSYGSQIGTWTGGTINSNTVELYSSITITIPLAAISPNGWEYLDGEFDVGCSDTIGQPGGMTASVTITQAGTLPSGQAVAFVEDPNPTSTTGTSFPGTDYAYCAPNAPIYQQPYATDQSYTTSSPCVGDDGTNYDPACTGTSLYLPDDGDVAATSWASLSMTTLGSGSACSTATSMTSMDVANTISSSSALFYGAVDLAFYGVGKLNSPTSVTISVLTQ